MGEGTPAGPLGRPGDFSGTQSGCGMGKKGGGKGREGRWGASSRPTSRNSGVRDPEPQAWDEDLGGTQSRAMPQWA